MFFTHLFTQMWQWRKQKKQQQETSRHCELWTKHEDTSFQIPTLWPITSNVFMRNPNDNSPMTISRNGDQLQSHSQRGKRLVPQIWGTIFNGTLTMTNFSHIQIWGTIFNGTPTMTNFSHIPKGAHTANNSDSRYTFQGMEFVRMPTSVYTR